MLIKLNKNNENVGVISIGETAKHIVQLAYDECCDIISTDIDITQLKSTRNEVDGLICFRNFIKRIAQDGMFCNYVKSKDIVIVFSSIGKKSGGPEFIIPPVMKKLMMSYWGASHVFVTDFKFPTSIREITVLDLYTVVFNPQNVFKEGVIPKCE